MCASTMNFSFSHNYFQGCTVGNITQVEASDPSFPFGYDQTQFDLCLDVSVLKDNLNSICEKVDDSDFQKIILVKLNQVVFLYKYMENPHTDTQLNLKVVLFCILCSFLTITFSCSQAFPSGVPDTSVQVLNSVSRMASLDDISKWSITKIDTLAALMNVNNGLWDSAEVQCRKINKRYQTIKTTYIYTL